MAAWRPRRSSAWPDLPADLLGDVLRGLPSLADRIRLRAVCRPWRSSAATVLHLSPPQLPWVVFHDGTLLDVSNNIVHRVRLPDDGATCYCAGENMLFLLHDDGRCSLMNTFSGDVTPLPELAAVLKARFVKSTMIKKAVISSTPKLVAVLFGCIAGTGLIAFTSCRPAGEINSCHVLTFHRHSHVICDIAFFQGKIHAITKDNLLVNVQLNNDEQTPRFGRRVRRSVGTFLPSTASHGNYEVRRYLFESNGKLLVVRRWVSYNWYAEPGARQLTVVEADLSHDRWNKVDSLEGRALFVSMLGSKSVPAAAAGAPQDCIYFLDEHNVSRLEGGLGDSGAYSMGDRTITPLLLEQPPTPLPLGNSQRPSPAWFFPVQA